ncbi:MAG: two-component sensor histidine kinase [Anaerolineae bacterium]|nr:two-component sensor histidine kinase [Anaerolineae bacterium]
MNKGLSASIHSRLFGKIFLSFLLVLFVWTMIFLAVNAVILNRSFAYHYNRLAQDPPQALREELQGMMGGEGNMMAPGGGQRLFGVRLLEEVQTLFRRSVNTAVRYASLAAFVVAILSSLVIARQLVQPMQHMSLAAQRIAEGHYAERVSLPEDLPRQNYDEWQDFAYQFNLMAQSLEDTESMRRQLIGDVAHEMRTPLTTIRGYMEALADGVMPAEADTYARIAREADRLQHLVADLQELSRVEAGAVPIEISALVPADLVENTMARLRLQFEEKGVALNARLAPGLPPVLADEERVHQVLLNLAQNALNYTPAGGSVTLSVARDKDQVHFCVQDSGIGIGAEHLQHIFTRFYRVDRSRSRESGGSGIGLTISKHLVEAMKGTIWAESEGEGRGAAFHFTLPAARESDR